ncbi:MAG TPA: hypothetical protein VMF65_11565 [Acidimicrobiales bacterium]|nr:hypothetical protein [Acidimicrobiales bacterium]
MSRARVIISLVGTAAVVVVPGAGITAVAAAAPSPAQLVASAFDAGLSEGSVRWISTEAANGAKIGIVSDVGRTEGSQVVTWAQGSEAAALSVVLVGRTAYLIGSAGGLYLQGFTATAATHEANKWIKVKPSSAAYGAAAAGLTMASALGPLKMAGAVTSVPGIKVLGVSTLGFKGTSKPFDGQAGVAETVYVRSTGTPLPVEVVQKGSTTEFGNWGEPIKVTAPLGAVPIQAGWLRTK